MTLLYLDRIFLEHRTGQHPECPERVAALLERLEGSELASACVRPTWEPAPPVLLGRNHSARYIAAVEQMAEAGGGQPDGDTVMSAASYQVATMAAGAVCDAVRRVVDGEDKRALCLVRPPGHHALPAHSMGFCLFNNIALGAHLAVDELGLERVLIVDWDVHHGNGTQDVFYEDPNVAFLSIHRWPFYPGTGSAQETGSGPGLGLTLNLPVEYGTSRQDYLDRFRSGLEQLAANSKPQLVLVSAGFDSHRLDPIGSLGLESEDFEPLTEMVLDVAGQYADGRLVSVLEGGYHTGALAEAVEIHLRGLEQATAT